MASINDFFPSFDNNDAIQRAAINALRRDRDDDTPSADIVHRHIVHRIREFESKLDGDHEVTLSFGGFGREVTMHLRRSWVDGDAVIAFGGVDVAGNPIQVGQGVTQLSYMIGKALKLDSTAGAKRFMSFIPDTAE